MSFGELPFSPLTKSQAPKPSLWAQVYLAGNLVFNSQLNDREHFSHLYSVDSISTYALASSEKSHDKARKTLGRLSGTNVPYDY